MLKGSKLVRWLGDVDTYDVDNGSSASLSLSEAGANTGTLLAGNMLEWAAGDDKVLAHVTGHAVGMLQQDINLYGTTDADAYRKQGVGDQWNIPAKKGAEVSIRKPKPGCEAIFEGEGVGAINNFVITSGTGAIASNTARFTALSVYKGGWRQAQTGEFVLAHLEQADLTPLDDDANLRIRIRFCSPYVKA